MEFINTIQDDNLGGLAGIRFAPAYFFSSITQGILLPGLDWITIGCISESMSFTEKTVNDANLGYIDTAIGGIVPKIRPDVQAILQKYRLQRVIVECEDMNGYMRRAGVTGRLILADQASTGSATADNNNYQIQFTGKQLTNALFV